MLWIGLGCCYRFSDIHHNINFIQQSHWMEMVFFVLLNIFYISSYLPILNYNYYFYFCTFPSVYSEPNDFGINIETFSISFSSMNLTSLHKHIHNTIDYHGFTTEAKIENQTQNSIEFYFFHFFVCFVSFRFCLVDAHCFRVLSWIIITASRIIHIQSPKNTFQPENEK